MRKLSQQIREPQADCVYTGDDPVTFIEREMYIPETGAPAVLHPTQRAVLRAMFARDEDGFKYSTMLYSAIKKHGKTLIGAALALWQGYRLPHGEIYIIGNDLRQADKRMANAMRYAIEHNPRMSDVRVIRNTIRLPNGTLIDSIPVDPKGEAGMNPSALFFTEFWGATQEKHKKLWTEAQLSPTRMGESFRFVESYAGYDGESELLQDLYNRVVRDGTPMAAVDEMYTHGSIIAYWNTYPYMPWQTEAYYSQQRDVLTPDEFDRIHRNQWSQASNAFVPVEWWDACVVQHVPMPDKYTPLVLAIDAGTESDCFAVVVVGRDPDAPGIDAAIVYYANVWTPEGETLRFDGPASEIRRLAYQYNILQFAYDPWQMTHLANELESEGLGWFDAFNQGAERTISDKMLYDMIRERRLRHLGQPDLSAHVRNANRKPVEDRLRLVKRKSDLKIDAAVALSMAVKRAMDLIPRI